MAYIVRPIPQPKRAATLIVAASDSKDKTRADYVCDGTDDQVEINDAISSLSSGGKVLLLEGTYNISDTINVGNSITLQGLGYGTLIKTGSLSSPFIKTSVDYIIIKDLRIDGTNASGQECISIQGSYNGVYGCFLTACSYGIDLGGGTDSAFYGQAINNIILSPSNDGILIYNLGNNAYFLVANNLIKDSGSYGIHLLGSNYNTIIGNVIYNSTTYDIYLQGSDPYNTSYNLVIGNYCGSSTASASIAENTTYNDYNIILFNRILKKYIIYGAHTTVLDAATPFDAGWQF